MSKELSAEVDALLEPWDRADTPGCAVAVIEHREVVHRRGYGVANLEYGIPITPCSLFHVASVSKQFTAFAVALLARDEKVLLDEDIRRYVPELPEYESTIRVEHLIHHISGLPDQWDLLNYAGWREDDVKTTGDILELITRQRELNFCPGTEYLYSNTGYTLLAVIVERVTGMSIREFTNREIFGPLGMRDTYFRDDHAEIVPFRTYAYVPRGEGGYRVSVPVYDTVGATSLITNVDDLAIWANAMAAQTFGGPNAWRRVVTPGRLDDGSSLEYAFGLTVREYRGLKTVEHSGVDAAYRAFFLRFPDRNLTVIVLCNLGTIDARGLAFQIADIYLEAALGSSHGVRLGSALREEPTVPENFELEALCGPYRDPITRTHRKVIREGDSLKLANLLGVDLTALSPHHYVGRLATIDLQFDVGKDGVHLLTERTPARERQFIKLREATLTPKVLSEYEGEYRSDALSTTITILRDGAGLVMHRPKFANKRLVPVWSDAFTVDDAVDVTFPRDDAGQVGQMLLATERSRNLRFSKVSRHR